MANEPSPIDLMAEGDTQLGSVLIQPRAGLVIYEEATTRLEPRLMQVLLALKQAGDSVATRRALSAQAWGDIVVGEDALNRCIARLRKQLSEIGAPVRIVTVPKIGYRLVLNQSALKPGSRSLVTPSTHEKRPGLSLRANRGRVASLAVVVAVALVTLGGFFFRSPPAQTGFALGEVVRLGNSDAREFDPALSPDGLWLAYAKSDQFAAGSSLFLRPLTGGSERRLNDDSGAVNPAWSPTGEEIAYVRVSSGFPCTLVVASSKTGARRDVGTCRNAETTSPAWSADGTQLFFHDQERTTAPFSIYRLRLADGAVAPVTQPRAGPGDMFASPSPDGGMLAFLRETAWRSGQIVLFDLAKGTETHLTQTASDIYGIAWEPGASALLVTSNLGGDVGLWRVPLNGGGLSRLGGAGVNYAGVGVGGGNRIVLELFQRRVDLERIGTDGGRLRIDGFERTSHCDIDPDIAPDGSLAFVSYRSGRSQLWMAQPGAPPQQVTNTGLDYLGGPRWSPDSLQIAASAAQNGQQDIVLFDRSGGQRPLTYDAAIDITPQWISGGDEILFISNRGGNWGVWAIDRSGDTLRSIMPNTRLAAMDINGGLLFQPTDKPGLWFLAPGSGVPHQVSPASLSGVARVHHAAGTFWVLDRAEAHTMQVWQYTPETGLVAVPKASGPFYPKSQLTFDTDGAIVVATLTGVENDVLIADLLPQTARSASGGMLTFVNRTLRLAGQNFFLDDRQGHASASKP